MRKASLIAQIGTSGPSNREGLDLVSPADAPHEGWLEKQQGGHKDGIVHHLASLAGRWQRRYFVLMHQSLAYYSSPGAETVSGNLSCAGARVERADDRIILIHAAGRVLKLRAADATDADVWSALLSHAAASNQGTAEWQTGWALADGLGNSQGSSVAAACQTTPPREEDAAAAPPVDPPLDPPVDLTDSDGGALGFAATSAAERSERAEDDHALEAYTEPESIYMALRAPASVDALSPVKLLKWSFLDRVTRRLDAAESEDERRRLALPRRQELERQSPEAFYSVEEVMKLPRGNAQYAGGPMAIVAVSHCWRTAAHADPLGETLCRLAAAIRRAQTATVGTHNATLPKDLAVFFEYASQPYRPDPTQPA